MKRIILIAAVIAAGVCVISFSKEILRLGFPRPYQEIVQAVSDGYGADELLMYSVIRAESRYDENAVSSSGAKGLMQIIDDSFDMIRENIDIGDDIYDPETNIRAGIWFYSYLYGILGSEEEAVRAYNCGLNNLGLLIPQTEIFFERVFEFYDIYLHIYSD